MARYTDPVCRLCRREGTKLFLKGERCFTDKCAIERRNYAPGQHGQGRRRKISEYAVQLREKQRLKRMYGLLEKQFKRYFTMAEKSRDVTGEALLTFLERRLDNMVYRLGLAGSRAQARQLIRHGHFAVNGGKVNIPSYLMSEGDEISVVEKSKGKQVFAEALGLAQRHETVSWLELNADALSGKVVRIPVREELPLAVNERLVVELYSK
ncbi:MAG TPA: 30S ribosomal protein S4 [Deltaproteobacteria bacterium]|nr:30S ribosomal protein S4 [Candidatus Binatota bacterium]HIL13563.1 30S ribosomal protein S4 [Deltaproteobacteria bacterium]